MKRAGTGLEISNLLNQTDNESLLKKIKRYI